ncbi:MAG: hypothetical protein AB1705_03030 [Verrucomicrobiota bacterium]
MSTTARIKKLVKSAIPKGKPFKIAWEPTGLGKSQILRVITPAWKSLPRSQRIMKLQQALDDQLKPQERAHIFRVSVLTDAEWNRLHEALPNGR